MADTKTADETAASALDGTEDFYVVQGAADRYATTAQLNTYVRSTFGTGVSTALSVNVGSAGAPVLFNGAGGTPSSLVLTNASGTVTNLTLVTPALGTPSALVLTNASGTVTNLTLVTPILGTPQSGTLTNCTLPVGGVSGLGTGVATFLATPSSANLASAITDETGSGALVFGTSPTISTALTVTGATETTTNPVINATQTWNASGTTFTLDKMNVTNTASAAGSLVIDRQVGATTVFNIRKDGRLAIPYGSRTTSAFTFTNNPGNEGIWGAANQLVGFANGGNVFQVQAGSFMLGSGLVFAWASSTDPAGAGADLFLLRKAAATLQHGNADNAAPTAQTTTVQSVVAGTSNTAGAAWTLKASAGTGTGAGGNFIVAVAPAGSTGTSQNAYVNTFAVYNTGGFGYVTGAGGTVTQATSRTTGVTLNTATGAITLVSAAGSAVAASFTVTNSMVAATDVIHLSQKSGTDLYVTLAVTNVAAGSFQITFATSGGVTVEQPVFNFAIIKGVTS